MTSPVAQLIVQPDLNITEFRDIRNESGSNGFVLSTKQWLKKTQTIIKYCVPGIVLNTVTIECMAHMANMVMGIAFGTSATVWRKFYLHDYKGAFCYVEYEDIGEGNKPKCFPPINDRNKSARRGGK